MGTDSEAERWSGRSVSTLNDGFFYAKVRRATWPSVAFRPDYEVLG